ncbi:helix-turn-helix domain-containing protein [Gordonia iterans]
MTSNKWGTEPHATLGTVLRTARQAAGLTFGALSEETGIARGQLHKLENDRVQKVNPAQLTLLAEPLGISIYQLFRAAGYGTPSALAGLGDELEAKLAQLPPEALERLEHFVNELAVEHGLDMDAANA